MLVKIGIDLDHSFDGINIVNMKKGDVFEFDDREGREIVDRFNWAEEYNEEEEEPPKEPPKRKDKDAKSGGSGGVKQTKTDKKTKKSPSRSKK